MRGIGKKKITLTQSRNVELFNQGPVKIITYGSYKDGNVVFDIEANEGIITKKLPTFFEIEYPQTAINIYVAKCGKKFNSFMLMHGNIRLWFQLRRSNNQGRRYRLFPTGTIMRIN